MRVSLCMIVKNEEACLSECLRSVRGVADEIIVVDTGSTDGTVGIAKKFGAKVSFFQWNDSFSDARNYALSKASGDWILVMDADDVLEREDAAKLLSAVRDGDGETDVYLGKTLCYSGEEPGSGGVLMNLNVRLIRSRSGFCYRGRVHEQVVRMESGRAVPFRMALADVRFHHYGYLAPCIRCKDKHARNIALIEKELAERPGDSFMLFNLGNEYFAMQEVEKAFGYYRESLNGIDPAGGYAPMLLLRTAMCCDALRRDEELFRLVRLGLQSCPRMTDFEFLRGNALCRQKKLAAAARSYLRCIRMGEPPADLSSVLGVGTFRPELALSGLYERFGEYDKAYRFCTLALTHNPGLCAAAERAVGLQRKKGRSFASAARKLKKLVPEDVSSCLMLSGVFFRRDAFREALGFAERAESLDPGNSRARYQTALCEFRLKKYARAYALFTGQPEGETREDAVWMRFFCAELAPASAGLKRGALKELTGPRLAVASAYRKLAKGKPCGAFPETPEGFFPYAAPVFDLLEVLLGAEKREEFHRSLPLLDLLCDEGTFLRLGKLYYRYGYEKPAYRALEESIRRYGKTDVEGLAIMRSTLASAG